MFTIKKQLLFWSCLVVLVFTSFNDSENEWVLERNENNVQVYSRKLPDLEVLQLKSITQIKTSLSAIVAVLNDREACPQWVYRCGKSYLIKKVNETEYYSYQDVVAPWPVDNRDIVFKVKLTQDPTTKIVIHNAESSPDFVQEVEGYVRVKTFNSRWILTPLKNGYINCENQVLVDPGGNIPVWLVNMAAVDGPHHSTSKLREMVMKDKYQNTKFNYIKELNN